MKRSVCRSLSSSSHQCYPRRSAGALFGLQQSSVELSETYSPPQSQSYQRLNPTSAQESSGREVEPFAGPSRLKKPTAKAPRSEAEVLSAKLEEAWRKEDAQRMKEEEVLRREQHNRQVLMGINKDQIKYTSKSKDWSYLHNPQPIPAPSSQPVAPTPIIIPRDDPPHRSSSKWSNESSWSQQRPSGSTTSSSSTTSSHRHQQHPKTSAKPPLNSHPSSVFDNKPFLYQPPIPEDFDVQQAQLLRGGNTFGLLPASRRPKIKVPILDVQNLSSTSNEVSYEEREIVMPHPDTNLPAWKLRSIVNKEKFPNGWKPKKKVGRDVQLIIKNKHRSDPVTNSLSTLSQEYGISIEAVRRIVKSKWLENGLAATEIPQADVFGRVRSSDNDGDGLENDESTRRTGEIDWSKVKDARARRDPFAYKEEELEGDFEGEFEGKRYKEGELEEKLLMDAMLELEKRDRREKR